MAPLSKSTLPILAILIGDFHNKIGTKRHFAALHRLSARPE
jgi:hypothetical protein